VSSPVTDIGKFREYLNTKGLSKAEKLADVVHIVEKANPVNVQYNFCLVRCDKDEIRIEDFLDLLCDSMMDYALSYEELHPRGMTKQQLNQWFIDNGMKLAEKANDAFIKKSKNTGEPGELFLFIALESRGFIRLLNKMALKTSTDMPFHGWDAVHVGVDCENILFCYGSSKMIEKFEKGVSDTFKEISDFTQSGKEKREINLISSYIDSGRFGKYSKDLTKMITPYWRDKENIGKAHCALISYEWDSMKSLTPPTGVSLHDYLFSLFCQTHDEMVNKIKARIGELQAPTSRNYYLWLLPVANLQELRDKFRKRLGVKPSEGTE
jgi:hypothetical protein